jgi:hypothetical protein
MLPNGSILSIAATYGSVKVMSALTNAAAAVGTLEASHGVIVGDIVEVTSGWGGVSGRVTKASAVATNDVTFAGIDTSNVARNPAGAGVGSVREVLTWAAVTQVLNFATSGGDQGFTNYSFLEEFDERQLPTTRSPISIAIDLADDASLAWYPILAAADEDRSPRALRLVLPNGGVILYNATVAFNRTPTLTKNEVMALKATFSLQGRPVRY